MVQKLSTKLQAPDLDKPSQTACCQELAPFLEKNVSKKFAHSQRTGSLCRNPDQEAFSFLIWRSKKPSPTSFGEANQRSLLWSRSKKLTLQQVEDGGTCPQDYPQGCLLLRQSPSPTSSGEGVEEALLKETCFVQWKTGE